MGKSVKGKNGGTYEDENVIVTVQSQEVLSTPTKRKKRNMHNSKSKIEASLGEEEYHAIRRGD